MRFVWNSDRDIVTKPLGEYLETLDKAFGFDRSVSQDGG
jgi:hypothetical protein